MLKAPVSVATIPGRPDGIKELSSVRLSRDMIVFVCARLLEAASE
jgi:hypothetical protein